MPLKNIANKGRGMDLFWTLVLLFIVMIVMFAIIPSFLERADPQPVLHVIPTVSPPKFTPDHMKEDEVQQKDQAMLASFYTQAGPVPVNHERKEIGACPVSKAVSSSLPVADVPLCLAKKPEYDMHIRSM